MNSRTKTGLILGGTLALGIFAGCAGASAGDPGKAEKEFHKVSVTPQVCLDALMYADEGFDLNSQAFRQSTVLLQALRGSDVAGMEAANEESTRILSELQTITGPYNTLKQACRESAE